MRDLTKGDVEFEDEKIQEVGESGKEESTDVA